MGGPAVAHQEVAVTTSRTPWGTWSASSLPCFHPARSLPWQGRRALAKYGTIRGRKNLPSFAGDEWRGRGMAGRVVAGDAALREHLRVMLGCMPLYGRAGAPALPTRQPARLQCCHKRIVYLSTGARSQHAVALVARPPHLQHSPAPGPIAGAGGPRARRGDGRGGGGQEKRRRRVVTDARVCPGVRPRLPPLRHR